MRILKYLFLTLLIPGVASADLTRFIANRLVAPNAKTSPIILGTSNSLDADLTTTSNAMLYTSNSASSAGAIAIGKAGADAYAQQLEFFKTRSTSDSLDANTIIANGDALGTIRFFGADGASYREGAYIVARVSAAPGSSDMPTDLEFWTTPDGTASATQKWTVTQAGKLLQDATSGGALVVSRGVTTPSMFGTASLDGDLTGGAFSTAPVIAASNVASGSGPVSTFTSIGTGNQSGGTEIDFLKTRSASATGDANTVVQSGDTIGRLLFLGADGANYANAAQIRVTVDGTPGTADMPGAIDFQVSPDGSATTASALKIKNTTDWIYTGSGGTTQNIYAADDNRRIYVCGGSNNSNGNGGCMFANGVSGPASGNTGMFSGSGADDTLTFASGGASSSIIFQANGGTKWTMDATGQLIGAGTASIGWTVVDETDNQACTTGCTTPAVFGINLAAGATAPVIVGPSDATADVCLCAGAS